MRRILLWLVIIILPTALWLALTGNGRAAWQLIFSHNAATARLTQTPGKAVQHYQVYSSAHPIVLLPAYPAPKNPQLQVQLYGNETITLYVVDPKGRRSGVDAQSARTLRQIPNSTVQRASANGNGGTKDEVITVAVDPALSTVYTLDVSAQQSGDFRLAVKGVSPALKSMTLIQTGHIAQDTLRTYRVRLKKIRPLPSFGLPGVVRRAAVATDSFISAPRDTVVEPTAPALVAAAKTITKDPCRYFYGKLKVIPHQKLELGNGGYLSLWDGKTRSGCQVIMVTKANVPDFLALDGSYLYRLGWRENYSYVADGTNGGMHAIENASEHCLFNYELPETLDQRTGRLRLASDRITYTIQCRRKGHSKDVR